ncbi:MAG: class I SAM-dependent methyltransferase [Candidatus Erginobacter occultus]|nr:class I SAM-dependent methyltransferase [Candidatus Erginobacter occultus]
MRALRGKNWWFKVHYPAILDLAGRYLQPGMRVLDLGSAGGWSSAELPNGVKRILLDLRPAALEISDGPILGRVCGDAHFIPLGDGSCDAVICEGLLHQCEATSPRQIVEEAVRVCRPGGVIISAEPAFNCLFGAHDLVFGGCRRYTLRSLEKLFLGLPVRCLKRTYLHLFAFPPAWVVRKVSRRAATDLSLGNSLTNTFCVWMGALERQLARRWTLPFGVTALLIMRKESKTSPVGDRP